MIFFTLYIIIEKITNKKMKTKRNKETLHQKYTKYQNWIMNPKYIEQEMKGYRLMEKLEKELEK